MQNLPHIKSVHLLGQPKGGKSKQAELLHASLPEGSSEIISLGDFLRSLQAEKLVALKQLPAEHLHEVNNAHLLRSKTAMKLFDRLIEKAIQKHRGESELTLIFAGSPRTISELRWFDRKIPTSDSKYLFLVTRDEDVLAREKRKGRPDEGATKFKRRLSVFYNQTYPMIRILADQDRLLVVDAMQPIDETAAEIRSSLRERGFHLGEGHRPGGERL